MAINSSPWCGGCQGGHYPVRLYDAIGGAATPIFKGGASGNEDVVTVGTSYPIPQSTIPTAAQGFGNLQLGDITINGGPLDAIIAASITDIIVERNIASASTVTLQIADPLRVILRGQILQYQDILELNNLLFALVEITKTGDQLQ